VSILSTREGCILDRLESGDTRIDIDQLLKKIKAELHPGQLEFADDSTTEILGLSAGYGSGKTFAMCCKATILAIANQGYIGCVMEPTGPLVRDIWLNDFDDYLDRHHIPHSFRSSPLPEYVLHLPGGDTKIICRSFESWSRIVGLNLAWVLCDEIDTVAPSIADKAFPKILGQLRAGNQRQFAVSSTPEGFRWMWNTFGTEEAKQRDDRKLIKMRTQDNPHLPADFIDRMKGNYDPKTLQAYLNGEFVCLTLGQVYNRFDRSKHICKVEAYNSEPIHCGLDFNVNNMSAVIAVKLPDKLVVIDEIVASQDTDSLAKEIRRRYEDRKVFIYPDASGGNRSTNASRTDIQILESYGFSNQSPRANPPVRDRVAAVQAVLENGKGEVRLQIQQNCRRLIECLELQSYNNRGEPDKEAGYDHFVDALGYLVWRQYNPLHARAGRGTGVRIY